MFKVEKVTDDKGRVLIQDPPIARFFFQSTDRGLVVAGRSALRGLGLPGCGLAQVQHPRLDGRLRRWHLGFWTGRWARPRRGCKPLITFDWYRGFLQFLMDTNSAGWFSYVIVFGELAVGIGLIVGAFVGLAATGGLLMNMAFMLAGTTSTNPVLAILGVLLILAWKNAGYIGLDYFLLPMLGTPWKQKALAPQAPPPQRTPAVATR